MKYILFLIAISILSCSKSTTAPEPEYQYINNPKELAGIWSGRLPNDTNFINVTIIDTTHRDSAYFRYKYLNYDNGAWISAESLIIIKLDHAIYDTIKNNKGKTIFKLDCDPGITYYLIFSKHTDFLLGTKTITCKIDDALVLYPGMFESDKDAILWPFATLLEKTD